MLAGNVVALLSPIIYIPILTYAFGPQSYDYKSMAQIRLANDLDIVPDLELLPSPSPSSLLPSSDPSSPLTNDQAKLTRASTIAKTLTASMTLVLLILWPMPLYGSSYVFSKRFFTGWVVVGILWLFGSAFCVGLYPLWEGRRSMAHTFRGIMRDLKGGKGGVVKGRAAEGRVSEEHRDWDKKGMGELVGEK